MMSFQTRFKILTEQRTRLCVGIDPSSTMLRSWGLPDDVRGLRRFCDIMLEAAGEQVAVLKPQSAFFERYGPEGLVEMRRFITAAKERGCLVLLDAKRGDISSTAIAYGEAYLGTSSPFGADAITLHAYLGFGGIRPIADIAKERGAAVFIVVLSSNPEGHNLQNSKGPDGRTVAEQLCDEIAEFNRNPDDEIGCVGAVIGATLGSEVLPVLNKLAFSLILAPGIGAQGAGIANMKASFGKHFERMIPSISRAVSSVGPSLETLKAKIGQYKEALK